MTEWTRRHGRGLTTGLATALFTLLLLGEVYFDDDPLTANGLLLELVDLALPAGATALCAFLFVRVRANEQESRLMRRDVEVIRSEGLRWREDMAMHLHALGSAIRRQLEKWRLTVTEQEIGLLLLKGFSHKEIARIRKSSEATIRQHATSIYRKAGLSGRAGLSAFFLEDLLDAPAPSARAAA